MKREDLIIDGNPDMPVSPPSRGIVAPMLDGVITATDPEFIDSRGRVFEVFSGHDEFWTEPMVFSHCFSIRPGQKKGWGVHLEKTDRYCLISGEVMTVLFDSRKSSPTCGRVMEVVLSPSTVRRLLIPAGVWHLSVNLGESEAFLVDFPTQPYNHARPDKLRLPADTPLIPYQLNGSH